MFRRDLSRTLEELDVRQFSLVSVALEDEFEQQHEGRIYLLLTLRRERKMKKKKKIFTVTYCTLFEVVLCL